MAAVTAGLLSLLVAVAGMISFFTGVADISLVGAAVVFCTTASVGLLVLGTAGVTGCFIDTFFKTLKIDLNISLISPLPSTDSILFCLR